MCLPLGLDPAHGGAGEPCGMESPRRGPSSPVLGQQEPKRLMVTFNLPQQNRKVWSKCATLASLLKGCLWRIPFSVLSEKSQLTSRAEQGRSHPHVAPLHLAPWKQVRQLTLHRRNASFKKSDPRQFCSIAYLWNYHNSLQAGIYCPHHLAYQINF